MLVSQVFKFPWATCIAVDKDKVEGEEGDATDYDDAASDSQSSTDCRADAGSAVTFDQGVYRVECPHCGGLVEVHHCELNCQVFRHDPRLSPHAPESACMAVDGIFGCGKPFFFDGQRVRKAGYES
eukprot:gnl/MRDRNA2_/MRDRNA2_146914_c0_seq1.p1 gnl/MRDRNA2_/MRDRNA2_146914_c0~~gnl/MRDRNA2_/MRDRNA2_146914_c0_seq1.p1  ORF type:complete len:126 (+),score=4.47 gnl/MRDRNA2_/MRDRNA2_146914_c0_seq1:97-474(+)